MTTEGAPRTDADEAHVSNEEEVAREFPHGDGRPLREQMPLIDEDGEDIRQYTGEPVETEDGWVLPQQMATGSQGKRFYRSMNADPGRNTHAHDTKKMSDGHGGRRCRIDLAGTRSPRTGAD